VAYDEESYNNCIVKLESVLGEIKNIEWAIYSVVDGGGYSCICSYAAELYGW
jgi:hypothetical protein